MSVRSRHEAVRSVGRSCCRRWPSRSTARRATPCARASRHEFDSRTRRSAELRRAARRSMPDGVPMAWMAGLYGHRPLFVARGAGCRFTDVDGNAYVDFNQADLSATCGFAPPAVLDGDRRARAPRAAVPAAGRGGDRGRRAARRALRAARLAVHALGLERKRGGDPTRSPPHRPRRDRRLRRPLPRPSRRHARGGRRARRAAAAARRQPARRGRHARRRRSTTWRRSSACSARRRRGRDHRAGAHERRRRAARPTASTRACARSRARTGRCSCSTRPTRRPSPTAA